MSEWARTIAVFSLAFAASAAGCNEVQTSALIEIQSDLSDELTRVDVEIRDGKDQRAVDQFSFDSSANPSYRVPFSFRVVPGEQSASQFVLHAVGYGGDAVLCEAKQTIAFVRRAERRHVVKLLASEDTRRDDGVTGTDVGNAGSGGAGAAGERGDAVDDAARSGKSESGGQPASGAGGTSTSAGGGASASTSGRSGSGGASGSAGAGSGGASGSSGAGAGGSSGSSGAGAGGSSGSSGAGAGGASGSSGAGAGGVTGKLLSGKDYTVDVTYLGRGYVVRNGVDNSGLEQTIRYENTSFSVVSVTGSAQDGTAWPAVYYGHLYGKASMDTNLPLRIDQIHNIDVGFKSNAGSVPGAYALTSALWFGRNAQKIDDNLPTAGMIEVWHSPNGIRAPAGAPAETAITVEGAPGTYDFYKQDCFWDGQTCITYLRNPPVSDFSGDLRPFVSDAMTRAPTVLGSWFLNAIITGFVIERNGSGLQLREVTAAVR